MCDGSIRLGFVRKVYSILAFQLLFTTGFVFLAMKSSGLQEALGNVGILIPVMVAYIASICAIVCCKMDKKVPVNYILLAIFTVCVSWLVATTTVRYD